MPDFATEKDRHNYIMAHADSFTAVVFMGRGVYDRRPFPTQLEAEAEGQRMAKETGKKVMIYAVSGNSDTLVKVL